MGDVAKVECRYCHKMVSLKVFREHHGEVKPKCVDIRWQQWIQDNRYRGAGSYTALLHEAGVVKMVPLYVYWRLPVDKDGNEVSGFHDKRYDHTVLHEYSCFTAIVPEWSYELAKKLSTDRTLARRLGFTQKRQLVTHYEPAFKKATSSGFPKGGWTSPKAQELKIKSKEWQPCDKDKQLPMHLRVKIMKVAAKNELAREMIADDPEAAGRLIKDLW